MWAACPKVSSCTLLLLGLEHAVLFEKITAAGDIMVASCRPTRHLSNRWMLDNANHMHENSLLIALRTSMEGKSV